MAEGLRDGSPYDKLSPALIEAAYVENERRNIGVREKHLSDAARKLDERLREEFASEVNAIAGDTELPGDQLVERYSQAVANSGDKYKRQQFQETMELKDSLYPGQVVAQAAKFGSEFGFYTVADTEDTPSVTPVLFQVSSYFPKPDEQPEYSFGLKVTFTDGDAVVNQSSRLIVGTENIAEFIASIAGNDNSAASEILQAANTLQGIGQASNAEDLRSKAADIAYTELVDEVTRDEATFVNRDERRMTDNFNVLASVAPDFIESVLDKFAFEIAKNADSRYDFYKVESKFEFVKIYLAHRRAKHTDEYSEAEIDTLTTQDVLADYSSLIERGKKLHEDAKRDESNPEGDPSLFTIS